MAITLSDEARRYIAQFAEETGVTATDCVIEAESITFVIPPEDMADAIGPDGRTVRRMEEQLGRDIRLVGDADRPADFIANAFAPAAITDVAIRETETDRVAYVDVVDEDEGVAIGPDGRTINMVRELANRHFDIDDITLV